MFSFFLPLGKIVAAERPFQRIFACVESTMAMNGQILFQNGEEVTEKECVVKGMHRSVYVYLGVCVFKSTKTVHNFNCSQFKLVLFRKDFVALNCKFGQ